MTGVSGPPSTGPNCFRHTEYLNEKKKQRVKFINQDDNHFDLRLLFLIFSKATCDDRAESKPQPSDERVYRLKTIPSGKNLRKNSM